MAEPYGLELPLDRRPATPQELIDLKPIVAGLVRPLARAALGAGELVFLDAQRLVLSMPTEPLIRRARDQAKEIEGALILALMPYVPSLEVVMDADFRVSPAHITVRIQIFDQAAAMTEETLFRTLHELEQTNSELTEELRQRGIRIQELEDQLVAMTGMLREAHRTKNSKLLRWIVESKSALLIALLTGASGGIAQGVVTALTSPSPAAATAAAPVVINNIVQECDQIVVMLDRIDPQAATEPAHPTNMSVRPVSSGPPSSPTVRRAVEDLF